MLFRPTCYKTAVWARIIIMLARVSKHVEGWQNDGYLKFCARVSGIQKKIDRLRVWDNDGTSYNVN